MTHKIKIIETKEKAEEKTEEISEEKTEEKVEEKTEEKTEEKVEEKDIEDPLLKSLKINYIFVLSILLSVYVFSYFSKTNFIINLIGFTYITLYQYFVHLIAHNFSFKNFYEKSNCKYLKNIKIIDYLINQTIYYIDFHDKIHHDSSLNKMNINIIIEFISNIFYEGGAIILLKIILNMLDNRLIIVLALTYATVHMINLQVTDSIVHKKHHICKYSNYGFDFWDIFFGTKYKNDNSEVENINNYSYNLIFFTGLVTYLFF
jgi:hypothetical protein